LSETVPVDEKKLCADWLAEFPLLKRYKGGRKLVRIYDPVVFGIELFKMATIYRPSYRPDFIAMSLVQPRPAFVLDVRVRDRRGLTFDIEYEDHPAEYMNAVEALRRAFPILSTEGVDERAIIELYRAELQRQVEHTVNPLAIWSSFIEILKYYGRADESAEEKRKMLALARTLPLARLYPQKSFAEYERWVESEVAAPLEVLLARRAEHIAKGGWDKLPGVVRSPRLDTRESHDGGEC
jgi:hypothetical protein